jgi:2-polyprenyl-3-methyl-5-hydroxy-6-metoxy-1,4-benzoquinol methylase
MTGEGPRTFSAAHLQRQRDAHLRADGYGRHRHLYLHARMAQFAERLRHARPGCRLRWLDYGCGKGEFIEQIRPLGLFDEIAGYDPAISSFAQKPVDSFDLVTCLDVLDTVEPRYTDAVLAHVAALSQGMAVFDCLTLPKRGTRLAPHPPFYWQMVIQRHLDILETIVEFAGVQDFERAVILAAPRPAAQGLSV